MILALDPGATTGWAYYAHGLQAIESGQWEYEEVYPKLYSNFPSEVVLESFMYRQRSKIDFSPVEVIGVVKLFCRENNTPLHMQSPAQVKHFFTDERLKERGVYRKGAPHANDAIRHLLFYEEFGKGRV